MRDFKQLVAGFIGMSFFLIIFLTLLYMIFNFVVSRIVLTGNSTYDSVIMLLGMAFGAGIFFLLYAFVKNNDNEQFIR